MDNWRPPDYCKQFLAENSVAQLAKDALDSLSGWESIKKEAERYTRLAVVDDSFERAIQGVQGLAVSNRAASTIENFTRMAALDLGPAINAEKIRALTDGAWTEQLVSNSAAFKATCLGFDPTLHLLSASSMAGYASAIDIASSITLPSALDDYRLSTESLAHRLSLSGSEFWRWEQDSLRAFHASAALADIFTAANALGEYEKLAASALAAIDLPTFSNVAGYGKFLDAAGLSLLHWPRRRELTFAERHRRMKRRVKSNRPSVALRRAFDLTYRYEVVLREELDAAMADEYGDDWALARLLLCDCKDLLGKWQKRGGEVLDHADFTHYKRIIVHPEHFSAVFHIAFETPEIASDLFERARELRVASHHPGHIFTPEDLRELRLVWRQIEVALAALTPDYELHY